MIIDNLKANTVVLLQEADKAGQRMLGAGISRTLFLKNVLMFCETFDLSPAVMLTGQFQDEKHKILYAKLLKAMIETISLLYGLSELDVMAVMDEIAAEQLSGFKKQLEDR